MKKTLFTINYHEFPNFLNDEDINTIIQTIYKGTLREYDYFEGRAYTSTVSYTHLRAHET